MLFYTWGIEALWEFNFLCAAAGFTGGEIVTGSLFLLIPKSVLTRGVSYVEG